MKNEIRNTATLSRLHHKRLERIEAFLREDDKEKHWLNRQLVAADLISDMLRFDIEMAHFEAQVEDELDAD